MERYDYWKLAEEDVPPRRLHAGPDEDEEDDCDDEMDLDDDE